MICGWKMLALGGLLFVGLPINLVAAQDATTAAAEATIGAPQEESLGVQEASDIINEQHLSNESEAVVPPVENEAKVLPIIQRTSDKVNEQPVRNGSEASGSAPEEPISVVTQASAVVQRPLKKKVIAIKPRSGIQPRDGATEAKEGTTTAAPGKGATKAPESKTAADGNGATEAAESAATAEPGGNIKKLHNIVIGAHNVGKAVLKKIFSRFLKLMDNAVGEGKRRKIVVTTSNHEVTDDSQKVKDAHSNASGSNEENDTSEIDNRLDGRSGIMARSMGHSSRLRARSPRRHMARTSYGSSKWIVVD